MDILLSQDDPKCCDILSISNYALIIYAYQYTKYLTVLKNLSMFTFNSTVHITCFEFKMKHKIYSFNQTATFNDNI